MDSLAPLLLTGDVGEDTKKGRTGPSVESVCFSEMGGSFHWRRALARDTLPRPPSPTEPYTAREDLFQVPLGKERPPLATDESLTPTPNPQPSAGRRIFG